MILADPQTHDEWLKCRMQGIGGSDASCITGHNKYKTNQQLWSEKMGKSKPEDISDKPAVMYGKKAEQYIRELFQLDYPQYLIDYHEYRMYCNSKHRFIFATLDGEIFEDDKISGILEIKTTTIQNPAQWHEWENRIPDNYYIQVLHQLIATGLKFVILRAYIRYYKSGELCATVRDYRIERSEVTEEIEWLMQKEVEFWKCIESNVQPNLILPEI